MHFKQWHLISGDDENSTNIFKCHGFGKKDSLSHQQEPIFGFILHASLITKMRQIALTFLKYFHFVTSPKQLNMLQSITSCRCKGEECDYIHHIWSKVKLSKALYRPRKTNTRRWLYILRCGLMIAKFGYIGKQQNI